MTVKRLTDDEFDALVSNAYGRGGASAAYGFIMALKVGEKIFISKESHTHKGSPLDTARRIEKKHKRYFEKFTLSNGSGWVLKRIA